MDDIRLTTAFPKHPKTRKLERQLGGAGVWALIRLFLWTADERPDGGLAGMTDEDLELVVDWPGPLSLIEALAKLRFLEGEAGSRRWHDWDTHQPWVSKKPERIERARDAANARWENRTPEYRKAVSGKMNAARLRRQTDTREPAAPIELTTDPTVNTCSNHACRTTATYLEQDADVPPTPPLHSHDDSPSDIAQPKPLSGCVFGRFDSFWEAYPKKIAKVAARKAWGKIANVDAICPEIIAGIARWSTTPQWGDVQFVPHPATFLNQRRWEDEIPVARMSEVYVGAGPEIPDAPPSPRKLRANNLRDEWEQRRQETGNLPDGMNRGAWINKKLREEGF